MWNAVVNMGGKIVALFLGCAGECYTELGTGIAIPQLNILKRILIRYPGDAYSFQCGIQLLIWGEKIVGWVGEYCSELGIRIAIP